MCTVKTQNKMNKIHLIAEECNITTTIQLCLQWSDCHDSVQIVMTVLASSICTSLPCYPPVTLLLLHVSNKSRTTIPTIPTVTFTLSRTPMPYCTVRAGSCRTELGRYIFNPEDVPKLLYPVLGVLAVPLGTYCTIVRTIYRWCWYRVLYLVFLITFCTYGLCISRI